MSGIYLPTPDRPYAWWLYPYTASMPETALGIVLPSQHLGGPLTVPTGEVTTMGDKPNLSQELLQVLQYCWSHKGYRPWLAPFTKPDQLVTAGYVRLTATGPGGAVYHLTPAGLCVLRAALPTEPWLVAPGHPTLGQLATARDIQVVAPPRADDIMWLQSLAAAVESATGLGTESIVTAAGKTVAQRVEALIDILNAAASRRHRKEPEPVAPAAPKTIPARAITRSWDRLHSQSG